MADFAEVMHKLQGIIKLSPELMQLIIIANRVSLETVELINDCVNGLIDIDQLITAISKIARKA